MKPRLLRDIAQTEAEDDIVRFCELLLAALEVPEIREVIRDLVEQPIDPFTNPPQPQRRTTPAAVRGRGGRRG
jgi:hypothetical protein